MTRGCIVALMLAVAAAMPAIANEIENESDVTRILVTFADPGMSNAARAGPPGPGYRRRSSSYLTSVGVKRTANRIAKDFELQTLDEWPILPLKVHCLVYGVASGVAVEDLLLRLRHRPEIDSAQLLNEFEVNGANAHPDNDPYAKLQHNLDTIELIEAHRWSRGDGASVTIIDTGADLAHPELRDQIADHQDFVGMSDSEFSADAHGTAVAGVIGAAANNGVGVIGVAPASSLSVLKACWYRERDATASCNTFTLAKALSYAMESGTDVINLSLGGPADALLGRLLRQAIERDIVVVAAAPASTQAGFPTNVSGVIVVGSADVKDSGISDKRFNINAPGVDILVPVPHGGYDFSSGRSLSAAHVSGIVALLIARKPHLSSGQISTLLADSRQAVKDSVNACRALAALLHESGCRNPEILSQSK